MKKNKKKLLFFACNCSLYRFNQAKLCILFLLFSITTVSARTLNPNNLESGNEFSSITNSVDLQQSAVTGTVIDAVTGEALIGVAVVVKGTTLGTLTDINGQFSLQLPQKEAILVFSFIGYAIQEISTAQGAKFSVAMQLEMTQISEVVVVGYGTQKKESMVGAITQVNNAALIKSGASNITNAISGKLSGVLTVQQTGEPGDNQAEILVRGLSSWSGSAPLILIDGVERDFSDMDPNEISTISVLKDASATAVFGSKGANGVIIVTTKRGFKGKPQLTFSGSTGIQVPTRTPAHIDSYTTWSMYNVAMMNMQNFSSLVPQATINEYRNPSTPLKAIQYPDVDWFDVNAKAFAPTSTGNINIVGGNDFVDYFCSLGYLYEGTFFKEAPEFEGMEVDSRYWYHRFNFRTNLDFHLTKSTNLSVNVGGEMGIKNNPRTGKYGEWASFYNSSGAQIPVYFPEWVLEQIPDTDYPDATGVRRSASLNNWYENPYNVINGGNFERYLTEKLYTDLILDQKLDFIIKGLSVKGKVSFNTWYSANTQYANYNIPSYRIVWSRVGVDANGDGVVDQNPWQRDGGEGLEYFEPDPLNYNIGGLDVSTGGMGDDALILHPYLNDLYYEMALNYSNSFGKHNVTGLALMNRQKKSLGSEFPFYNAAYVGRLTYGFSNKYLAEVNIGYTGSEQFAPGNRYGFFPSGAVGWVISEESFFKNAVPWMNKFKVRYSDGLVGSDHSQNRWLYKSDFFTDDRGYIHEDRGANTLAQWEEARKKDLGIEVSLFKNLFTLSVDFFDEKRSKMLITPRSLTPLIGNTFKDLNLGSLKKHGIEVEFEFNKTTPYNLTYFIKGNFGFSENRVIFKDDPLYTPDYLTDAGKPIGAQLRGAIQTGSGYFTSVNDIHINPSPVSLERTFIGDYKFLEYTSDGIINTADNYPIPGQTYAPIVYSFSSGFSYKGFDFNFMFQGNQGKNIKLGNYNQIEFFKASINVHTIQLDYWRPDNQNATHGTLHYNAADLGDAIHSWGETNWLNHYWREASYLRLKEVYAAYNINSGFLKRIAGISNMLVYLNATNLLTFTKLTIKEYDPEVKSPGFYPQLSRYNIGVKFTF